MNRLSYNPFSLKDKTLLVTGASSGIGRSIAVECSRLGANVYITARNEERLCKTLLQMEGEGHQMILSDLSEERDIDLLVDKLPLLDGVVHCAGIQERMLCKMLKSSDIENIMAVNFNAADFIATCIVAKEKNIQRSFYCFYSFPCGFCSDRRQRALCRFKRCDFILCQGARFGVGVTSDSCE